MKVIYYWLLSGLILVFAMVVVGGITRLTHSGLSITEWDVIMGAIPPLSENEWAELFEKYQQSPEYEKVNFSFTLPDFKEIFWWEYVHRLLGRIIGIVFIIPFIWFIGTKKLSGRLLWQVIGIFLLGAFQGLLGWLMVESGLVDIPRVSHYRLAAHLVTAMATMGYILWVAMEVSSSKSQVPSPKSQIPSPKFQVPKYITSHLLYIKRLTFFLFCITILQIIYGVFVAGLRAGLIYNTFPMMGDEWISSWVIEGFRHRGFVSLFENLATVQFIHRWLAFVVFFLVAWQFLLSVKIPPLKKGALFLLIAVSLQLLLGVLALLFAVPLWIGVAHQAVAMLIFCSIIYHFFILYQILQDK
ncbi:MAG: COX15/CtaA family protein [Bacteroidetes bacterium]|nr:COX15/CtaA family protein [Bacteroidota bacterium]